MTIGLVVLVVLVNLQCPHLVAVYSDAAFAVEVDAYIYYIAHVCALEVEQGVGRFDRDILAVEQSHVVAAELSQLLYLCAEGSLLWV